MLYKKRKRYIRTLKTLYPNFENVILGKKNLHRAKKTKGDRWVSPLLLEA